MLSCAQYISWIILDDRELSDAGRAGVKNECQRHNPNPEDHRDVKTAIHSEHPEFEIVTLTRASERRRLDQGF